MIDRSTCPGCHSASTKTILSVPWDDEKVRAYFSGAYQDRIDYDLLTEQYTLEECSVCGLSWQRYILDDHGMELLYDTWISPEKSAAKRKLNSLILQYAKHCARLLRLFPNPHETHVMDYGMGWGEWCHMAQSFGFQVHGVELSTKRIEAAKKRGISASLPTEIPEQQFDFIYTEQVLEHVPNPREVLEMLLSKLKSGGYIHIGVPDGTRIVRHPTKDAVMQKSAAQPLEHINVFTPTSLKYLLQELGCTPAKQKEGLIRTTSIGVFLHDLALACLRILPTSVFPPGTSLLFQKN